jgi:hypothetical protein
LWTGVLVVMFALFATPESGHSVSLGDLPVLLVGGALVMVPVGLAVATFTLGPTVVGAAILWSVLMWSVRRATLLHGRA